MSDNDKCPTCGIAREHDGPRYHEALKQAGKPMCPDPFHVTEPDECDYCRAFHFRDWDTVGRLQEERGGPDKACRCDFLGPSCRWT